MYHSGEIKAQLDRVIAYLGNMKYSEYLGPRKTNSRHARIVPFASWIGNTLDAIDILKDAKKSFDAPTPADKRLKKATTEIETSFGTLVVVDMQRLEYEMVKDGIGDALIQSLLPFQTSLVEGENFIHIQNDSAYTVETKHHFIHKGETLCAKSGETFYVSRGIKTPTCPGCIAKGKGIAAYHLTK